MNKKEKMLSFGIPLILIVGTAVVIIFKNDIKRFTTSSATTEQVLAHNKKGNDEKVKSSRLKRKIWATKEAEEKEVKQINEQLKHYLTDDDRLDLLSELYGSTNPLVLDIVYRELDNPNVDIRLDALDLLSEFKNEEIFENLSKALNDKSEDVRIAAIELLDDIEIKGGSSYEADLLAKGVGDKSEDVREAALSVLQDKPKFEIETIAETAIASKYPEVKEEILSYLTQDPSMNGVEIIMKGLLDKNQEFKENVQFELEVITDQEFDSYEEAKEWWNKNKALLEDDLKQEDDEDNI